MNFKTNGYEVVKGAISLELADFVYRYLLLKRNAVSHYYNNQYIPEEQSSWYFGGFGDGLVPTKDTYYAYGDWAIETLLTKLQPSLEKITSMRLLPTFAYTRIYVKGNTLEKHKDRPQCEFSTTLNLGGKMWPIFLCDPNKKKDVKVSLHPGDMLIYKGEQYEHYRLKYNGDNCAQAFFFYKEATQENLKSLFDGRPALGLAHFTSKERIDTKR